MRSNRTQERAIDSPGADIRWWSLYETLADFGSALSYPTKWNEATGRWVANTAAQRQLIYSTVEGLTGAADEIVATRWSPNSRRWELLPKGTPRKIVQWYTSHTANTSLADGYFSQADPVSFYFENRLGDANIGLTHDPAEADPTTNGNFTVTSTGMYIATLYWRVVPGGTWSFNHMGRLTLWVKPDGGAFTWVQPLTNYVSLHEAQDDTGTVTVSNEVSWRFALEEDDVIRILAHMFGTSGSAEEMIAEVQITFEKVSDTVIEAVAIP